MRENNNGIELKMIRTIDGRTDTVSVWCDNPHLDAYEFYDRLERLMAGASYPHDIVHKLFHYGEDDDDY